MDDKLLFLGIILIAFLIHKFFFSKAAIVNRKLREVNGKKISAFTDDETGKVVGQVIYAGKTITAPLSGRKCVYYHILVEQLESTGRYSSWQTFIEEEVASDVVIKDGNNYAVIETNLVKSHLVLDRKYSSGLFTKATEQLNKYLEKHGKKSTDNLLGLNRTLRYKEGILEEGEMLAVVGKGKWVTKNELKLKVPADKILEIRSENQEPIYLSDDPEVTDEVK